MNAHPTLNTDHDRILIGRCVLCGKLTFEQISTKKPPEGSVGMLVVACPGEHTEQASEFLLNLVGSKGKIVGLGVSLYKEAEGQ